MPEDTPDTELDRRGEELLTEYLRGVRDFSGRVVSDVRIIGGEFVKCDFTGTRFTNCVLSRGVFDDSLFVRARFERCNVQACNFHRATLDHAVLGPAVFKGSDFWLAWLRHANFKNCDASDTYFGGANLHEASLYGGRFTKAWFLMTNLTGCTFIGADFENAIVRGFINIGSDTLAKNAALLRKTLGGRKQFEEFLRGRRRLRKNGPRRERARP